ncbi:MAG TPA: hypothetical protein VGJ32_14070 [Solirubrobacteraceae bacterium]|jgi:hypothetical protein
MENPEEPLSTRDLVATAEPPAATDGAPETTAGETRDVADEAPLLEEDQAAGYRRRWEEIQAGFVDEPRRAVEEADGLVATVMQELAEGFARERERLESHWDRGDDVSTEDLRVGLQRYRSFFRRLLSA